jgi:hypothetical protein
MVEEPRPTKKVVKKVVKKTVVRPVSTTTARYTAPAAPKATAAARPKKAVRRPSIDLSSARTRGAGVARGVGDRFLDARDILRDGAADVADAVRGLRLPHLVSWQAAVVSGLVVGLTSVVLGWASAELFTATRGTSSGGGWGALALVVVAFLAFFLGELLLDGFGVEQPRLTSFLGVVLVFVVILGAFLEPAQSQAAWILLPALGAVLYAAAERLVTFAVNQPTEQR